MGCFSFFWIEFVPASLDSLIVIGTLAFTKRGLVIYSSTTGDEQIKQILIFQRDICSVRCFVKGSHLSSKAFLITNSDKEKCLLVHYG